MNSQFNESTGFFNSLFKRSVSSRIGISVIDAANVPVTEPPSPQFSITRSIEAQLLYTLVDNYDMYQRHVQPAVAKRMLLALRDTVDDLVADIDKRANLVKENKPEREVNIINTSQPL